MEEQSVLTGGNREKIGHHCQDLGEATEDLCRIRQAGPKLPAWLHQLNTAQMCSTYFVMLTDSTVLLRFHYISIQTSPDGALWLCSGSLSSECSYTTTLTQSTGDITSQPALHCCCCCLKVFPGFLSFSLIVAKEECRKRHLIIQLWSRTASPHSRKCHILFLSGEEKSVLPSFGGWGRELVGGGRGSRKDAISQLSTPAWFSSVSEEGFHT